MIGEIDGSERCGPCGDEDGLVRALERLLEECDSYNEERKNIDEKMENK